MMATQFCGLLVLMIPVAFTAFMSFTTFRALGLSYIHAMVSTLGTFVIAILYTSFVVLGCRLIVGW